MKYTAISKMKVTIFFAMSCFLSMYLFAIEQEKEPREKELFNKIIDLGDQMVKLRQDSIDKYNKLKENGTFEAFMKSPEREKDAAEYKKTWFGLMRQRLACAEQAYKEMPESALLASTYAKLWFHHWEPQEVGKIIEDDNSWHPVRFMKIIIPFLLSNDPNNNLVFYHCYTVFENLYYTIHANHDNADLFLREEWKDILSEDEWNVNSIMEYAMWFADQVNIETLPVKLDEKALARLISYKNKLTDDEREQVKQRFQQLIGRVIIYESTGALMKEREEKFTTMLFAEHEKKRNKALQELQAVNSEKQKQLDKVLSEMTRWKNEIDLDYLKMVFDDEEGYRLTRYRSLLGDYKELPNTEKLKKMHKNPRDVDIMNLWYKVFVLRNVKDLDDEMAKFEEWEKDERLVWLKIYCANTDYEIYKTPKNYVELKRLLDGILQISPDSIDFLKMKLDLLLEMRKQKHDAIRQKGE